MNEYPESIDVFVVGRTSALDTGQFIIIGIVLTSQIGSRIIPFVISRSPEMQREIGDLSLSSDQLLFANDFLDGDRVPDVKALAGKLLSDHKLYLTSYRTKEDTKRYYQFLYEKQILSLNLSADEHLSAFAKVVQSFSKAKSLDLSPTKASKSLKQFLFDDIDLGLDGEFKRQQGQLEKLLRDFSSLESYINDLRSKQLKLTELKKKYEYHQGAHKKFHLGKISSLRTLMSESEKTESTLKENLENEKALKESMESLLAEIPDQKNLLKEKLTEANEYKQLHIAYLQATEDEENLKKDVVALKVLYRPIISSEWLSIETDIDEPSVTETKQKILKCSPYLEKFNNAVDLENAFDLQKNDIAQLYQTIKNRITDIDRLNDILSNNTEDSVLGWGIKNRETLTKEQQAALLRYGTHSIVAPISPQNGDKYINSKNLIEAVYINNTSKGFWLHLGALHEFITFDPDEINPFSNTDNNQTIIEIIQKLTEERKVLNLQLIELDSIQRGISYNSAIILRNYDPFLAIYNNIQEIKTTAFLINDIDGRVLRLEEQYSLAQSKLKQIRAQLPAEIIYDEPEVVERELKRLAIDALDKYTECCQGETIAKANLQQSESTVRHLISQITDATKHSLQLRSELATHTQSFYNVYSEIPEENLPDYEYADVNLLGTLSTEAKQDYQVKYLEIVSYFSETNTNMHPGVNREINEKSYDFSVLESALLGIKIKHTDEISQELEDANRNRINMADDIKNTMVLIFNRTVHAYKQYKTTVYTLNQFFQGVKISNRFFFNIDFAKNDNIKIEILEDIGSQVRNAAKRGELPFDKPVGSFIEEFFKKTARLKETVTIDRLLDPKTFFDLSVSLTDEYGEEIPGSTGETYSAIALLGIARLSLVQKEKRRGLRFIILEELGSLDTVNFNTFPAIAKEFSYQIITMAPTPFRSNLDDEWYAHHLIKGITNQNINYRPSASYFKTKNGNQELEAYLKTKK